MYLYVWLYLYLHLYPYLHLHLCLYLHLHQKSARQLGHPKEILRNEHASYDIRRNLHLHRE